MRCVWQLICRCVLTLGHAWVVTLNRLVIWDIWLKLCRLPTCPCVRRTGSFLTSQMYLNCLSVDELQIKGLASTWGKQTKCELAVGNVNKINVRIHIKLLHRALLQKPIFRENFAYVTGIKITSQNLHVTCCYGRLWINKYFLLWPVHCQTFFIECKINFLGVTPLENT